MLLGGEVNVTMNKENRASELRGDYKVSLKKGENAR